MADAMGGTRDERWQEVQGLALTAFGVQFSVFANSLMKTVNSVPVLQAMQIRFIIQICFTGMAGAVLFMRGRSIHFLGKPGHRLMLLGRAACFATAILSLWTALRLMPVGDATTIVYLYPVFCGIIANRFLGEPLGWRFWVQAAVCCTGVLLVTGGGLLEAASAAGGSYSHGVALALLAALGFASTNCCVRALKNVETIEVQLFTDAVMALVAMPSALLVSGNYLNWSGWDANVFFRLAGATGFGLCALLIVILGHQLAPASKATLFTYLEVPSAFVVQALVFGEMPGLQKLLGAALILSAAGHRFWCEATQVAVVEKTPLLEESANTAAAEAAQGA